MTECCNDKTRSTTKINFFKVRAVTVWVYASYFLGTRKTKLTQRAENKI